LHVTARERSLRSVHTVRAFRSAGVGSAARGLLATPTKALIAFKRRPTRLKSSWNGLAITRRALDSATTLQPPLPRGGPRPYVRLVSSSRLIRSPPSSSASSRPSIPATGEVGLARLLFIDCAIGTKEKRKRKKETDKPLSHSWFSKVEASK
jgi:hypothetical protein